MSEDKEIIKFLKKKEYIKLKDVGQGGTGNTKLLMDETIGEVFICKKYSPIYPEQKKLYFNRFVDEVKILYKINHPNIVRIFNYYLYPNLLTGYILMEYVEGEDIESYIETNPNEINSVFVQLISGFKYLEGKEILHRDIRPSNILVANDGTVKIIDFGFGKNVSSCSDYKKSITLNWNYSLPDEFADSIYDFRTEIFFVGKLIERILVKNKIRNLFKYTDVLQLMIQENEVERLTSFGDVSRAVIKNDAKLVEFTNHEKNIYNNIANALMSVCVSLDPSAKYSENISMVTTSLEELIQKNALEYLIQKNETLINCFIDGPFTLKRKAEVSVDYIKIFYSWWQELNDRNRRIVLNNLWQRFDTIKREEIIDLPF